MDKEYFAKILEHVNGNSVSPFKCPECGEIVNEIRIMGGGVEEIRMNFTCRCGNKKGDTITFQKVLPAYEDA